MELLKDRHNLMTQAGLYEQEMQAYKDGDYIIQIFSACKYSWFYVLIYKYDDELIGVITFITDGKQTIYKIKYAKYKKIVDKLINKIIKIKETEYGNRFCKK